MIELTPARPPWVPAAITELRDIAAGLQETRDKLAEIALLMTEGRANTTELADSAHDLEHAERHLTAARRSLEMTWPEHQ